MRLRYFSYLSLAVAAAFLIASAVGAFSLSVGAELALGVGVFTLVVSLAVAAQRPPGISTAIGAAAALISAWMIVASAVFSVQTVKFTTFWSALAIGVLALAGMIIHELTTEQVVHSLEVSADERADRRTPIAA
jgi:hypothetical protein